MFGVPELGAAPDIHEVFLRRFLCVRCGAVVSVGPFDIAAGLLYGLLSVVVILARWGSGVALPVLRRQFGVGQHWGEAGASTWRSVRRWTARAAEGRIWSTVSTPRAGTRRAQAQRLSWILGGAGPPGEALERRAVAAVSALR